MAVGIDLTSAAFERNISWVAVLDRGCRNVVCAFDDDFMVVLRSACLVLSGWRRADPDDGFQRHLLCVFCVGLHVEVGGCDRYFGCLDLVDRDS